MIKAVIIDDEQHSIDTLKWKLENYCPDVVVQASFDSPAEGISYLKQNPPDLLFLDIEMPMLNGFDVLEELGRDLPFDIIFITAYDNFGIQAVKFSALDYLLKPVDPDELKNAVQRHIGKQESEQQKQELYENLVQNIEKKEVKDFKIAVPSAEGVYFFMIDDILRLEADRSYTHIHLVNKKPFLASKTLKHFEDMLEEFRFIRTHKSHLVNPSHITRISNDHEFVLLTDGSKVEVSRRKKDEVMQQLNLR